MNYEQKYKEALENFKIIKNANKDNKELVYFIECEYPELRESEDEKIRKDLITYINSIKGDTLDLTMRAHEWLCWLEKQKEKKQIIAVDSDQLLKILPRTAEWSEEDEKMCSQVINEMEAIKSNSSTILEKNIAQEKIDWLKSLKPQSHWKPSEEQMSELGKAAILQNVRFNQSILESLYNDLKSL